MRRDVGRFLPLEECSDTRRQLVEDMGYDPTNRMTLVVWTNLTVSPDGKPTANSIMLKVLDQVYVESPLR
jgi:hypothetical protein